MADAQSTVSQPDQPQLVGSLEHGSPEERRFALKALVEIVPPRRSTAANRALAKELGRVNRLVEKRLKRPGVVDSEWDNEDLGDYLALLVRANADTPDLVALEPLIDALGTGRMAVEGVAKFGIVALDPLIRALSDQLTDPTTRTGAARCLSLLASKIRLNEAQRKRLDDVLVRILTRPERFVITAAAIDLAVNVAASDALRIVERIAETGEASLVDADPLNRANVQARAKRALNRPR